MSYACSESETTIIIWLDLVLEKVVQDGSDIAATTDIE